MAITREQLIPLIGKPVSIVFGGQDNPDIFVKDVGETYLIGHQSGSDAILWFRISSIKRVVWKEEKRHVIE